MTSFFRSAVGILIGSLLALCLYAPTRGALSRAIFFEDLDPNKPTLENSITGSKRKIFEEVEKFIRTVEASGRLSDAELKNLEILVEKGRRLDFENAAWLHALAMAEDISTGNKTNLTQTWIRAGNCLRWSDYREDKFDEHTNRFLFGPNAWLAASNIVMNSSTFRTTVVNRLRQKSTQREYKLDVVKDVEIVLGLIKNLVLIRDSKYDPAQSFETANLIRDISSQFRIKLNRGNETLLVNETRLLKTVKTVNEDSASWLKKSLDYNRAWLDAFDNDQLFSFQRLRQEAAVLSRVILPLGFMFTLVGVAFSGIYYGIYQWADQNSPISKRLASVLAGLMAILTFAFSGSVILAGGVGLAFSMLVFEPPGKRNAYLFEPPIAMRFTCFVLGLIPILLTGLLLLSLPQFAPLQQILDRLDGRTWLQAPSLIGYLIASASLVPIIAGLWSWSSRFGPVSTFSQTIRIFGGNFMLFGLGALILGSIGAVLLDSSLTQAILAFPEVNRVY